MVQNSGTDDVHPETTAVPEPTAVPDMTAVPDTPAFPAAAPFPDAGLTGPEIRVYDLSGGELPPPPVDD